MTDVIILMILIILIGAAVSYIVKEKKNMHLTLKCTIVDALKTDQSIYHYGV